MFAIAFDLVVAETTRNHPKGVAQAYADIRNTLMKFGFEWRQGSLYTTDMERALGWKPQETFPGNFQHRPGAAHCRWPMSSALWRKPAMSRLGGAPKRRLYSRLNCEGLS